MAASEENIRTEMQATLKSFLENYDTAVEKQDTCYLSAKLTADCERRLAPTSYLATFSAAKAAETNGEYEARMKGEIAVMEATRHKVLSLVVDPVERKGSAHAEHWTKVQGHEGITLEICWFVDFTPDGRAISKMWSLSTLQKRRE